MRAKIREVLDDCIAQGIDTGYHRAYKYNDSPSRAEFVDSIENEIWLEIDRHFDFEQCASRNVCDEVVKGFDQLEKEREWVYLTEEEMLHIVNRDGMQLAEAIEAKIRAKNG